MMTSIFDQADRPFLVLRNEEEQYSLWPAALPVPDGWQGVFGPDERGVCAAYIEANWTDMRPRSLREALG
jgi:MbtH protein